MNTLHWSPRSPYVRKVLVALHEKELMDEITTVRTLADPMAPPEAFFATYPLAKIPTLEREGAPPIWDSRVVMEWADLQSQTGPRLFPADPGTRIEMLTDEAFGTGIMEVGIALLVERQMRAPERQDSRVFAVCERKFQAALDYLEANVTRLATRPFDAGHISVGVALCYLDFRVSDLGWRNGRPTLGDWHQGFCARSSVQATEFRDDL